MSNIGTSRSSRSSTGTVEDIWAKLDKDPSLATPSGLDSSDTSGESTILFVGESGSGKSSLIQTFLKPTVTKEPKSTFALEYSFARKKGGSNSASSRNLAHIWELGGDIYELGLLEIPLSASNFQNATVFIVCDLSKPQNLLESVLKWISGVREVIKKRIDELKSTNRSAVTMMKDAAAEAYAENSDRVKVRPCEIPLYIVANKWDTLKSKNVSLADRRSIFQVLRFIAHYNGCNLMSTSLNDANLKEAFRSVMSITCFKTGTSKASNDTMVDKPVQVTPGQDSFENILIGNKLSTSDSDPKVCHIINISVLFFRYQFYSN